MRRQPGFPGPSSTRAGAALDAGRAGLHGRNPKPAMGD